MGWWRSGEEAAGRGLGSFPSHGLVSALVAGYRRFVEQPILILARGGRFGHKSIPVPLSLAA